jgi:ribonuclease E
MEKNLYIDASHPEETRIVLRSENGIEAYEYENKNKLNFKSNIYLGTVSRVEPSLQAAFINFGRVKHGFLAFNDIQSDYYQIPTEDKERLQEVEEKIREDLKNENLNDLNNGINTDDESVNGNNKDLENSEENPAIVKEENSESIIYKNEDGAPAEIEKKNNVREKI